jgi:hypothetical protein
VEPLPSFDKLRTSRDKFAGRIRRSWFVNRGFGAKRGIFAVNGVDWPIYSDGRGQVCPSALRLRRISLRSTEDSGQPFDKLRISRIKE